jgi:20S proteasome alpha/beta subunit
MHGHFQHLALAACLINRTVQGHAVLCIVHIAYVGCLQVWACPIGGTLVREQWTTDGSGSTYIWGFLDSAYRYIVTQSISESSTTEAVDALIYQPLLSLCMLSCLGPDGSWRHCGAAV